MEYTFTWFIENYSYCLEKIAQPLFSPQFVSSLDGTAWRICLYPRGIDIDSKGYISLFLQRSDVDYGPVNILLKYTLSFLAADGAAVISQDLQHPFVKESVQGCDGFLKMQELFSVQKATLLPKDTLIVSCKMRYNEGDKHNVGQSSARTIIGTEHVSFIYEIPRFKAFTPQRKRNSTIKYTSAYVHVRSTMEGPEEWRLFLEITFPDLTLSTCNLFLVGASGILTKCGEADNRSDDEKKDICRLPLTLTINDIVERKEEYYPEDILTFLCQCTLSTGKKFEIIEKALVEIPSVLLNQINIEEGNNGGYIRVNENMSTCSNATDIPSAD